MDTSDINRNEPGKASGTESLSSRLDQLISKMSQSTSATKERLSDLKDLASLLVEKSVVNQFDLEGATHLHEQLVVQSRPKNVIPFRRSIERSFGRPLKLKPEFDRGDDMAFEDFNIEDIVYGSPSENTQSPNINVDMDSLLMELAEENRLPHFTPEQIEQSLANQLEASLDARRNMIIIVASIKTSLDRIAIELHEQSGRWAMVGFGDLPQETVADPERLTQLGAMTIFVRDVHALTNQQVQQIAAYLEVATEAEGPLFVCGSDSVNDGKESQALRELLPFATFARFDHLAQADIRTTRLAVEEFWQGFKGDL